MHPAEGNPGERITRGITRLASACPRWWAEGPAAVDLDTIDFLDLKRGILAQVCGSHEEGLGLLAIPAEQAAEFGFAARDDAGNEALQRIWRVITGSFRAEAAMPNPPRRKTPP